VEQSDVAFIKQPTQTIQGISYPHPCEERYDNKGVIQFDPEST